MKNYAFIDGQNLHLETSKLGWKMDYKRLRVYLKDKHKVQKVFYFIGYKKENKAIYESLKKNGYTLIFKEVIGNKGNCDSDLIVQCFREIKNYDGAVVVSGDGDFSPLYKYLRELKKLHKIGIPSLKSKSRLLNPYNNDFFFIEFLKNTLSHKKTVNKKKRSGLVERRDRQHIHSKGD